MHSITQSRTTRALSFCIAAALISALAGCGGPLYKVKKKIDAPITDGKVATASGFTVKAVPLLTDEESQELFEANLALGGLLPIRVEISNDSDAPLLFKKARFQLRDSDGNQWKLSAPKQVVSRILKDNQIFLYNPHSRKEFEKAVGEHAFDLETPLDPGRQRRGLIFFQTPKKEQLSNPRGLVLTIDGLPQAVEVIFNE